MTVPLNVIKLISTCKTLSKITQNESSNKFEFCSIVMLHRSKNTTRIISSKTENKYLVSLIGTSIRANLVF